MTYRSPKLRQSARGQSCVLCGIDDGTVVAAHCNDGEWRGMGLKAPDCLIAHLCVRCHDRIDGRAGGLSKDEKRAEWDRAFKRTVVRLFEQGVVKA